MLRPLYAGWYAGDDPWTSIYGPPLRLAEDARRLDISPAWLAWAGTVPALELLAEVGIAAIHRHDLGLANALRDRLGLPRAIRPSSRWPPRAGWSGCARPVSGPPFEPAPCGCPSICTTPKPTWTPWLARSAAGASPARDRGVDG